MNDKPVNQPVKKTPFNILNNFQELAGVPSVAELRRKGYKVAIRHERPYLCNVGVMLASKNEKMAMENLFKHSIGEPLSTGGSTFVHIYKDGKSWHGMAVCSPHDNFCRRIGIAYAIKRSGLEESLI